MQPVDGSFRPSDEVDEVRWVALDELPAVLSHSRELPVVEALRDLLTPVGVRARRLGRRLTLAG